MVIAKTHSDHHKYQFGGRKRVLANGEQWYEILKCTQTNEWTAAPLDLIDIKHAVTKQTCFGGVVREYDGGNKYYVLAGDGEHSERPPRAVIASDVVHVTAVATASANQDAGAVDQTVDAYAAAMKVRAPTSTFVVCDRI